MAVKAIHQRRRCAVASVGAMAALGGSPPSQPQPAGSKHPVSPHRQHTLLRKHGINPRGLRDLLTSSRANLACWIAGTRVQNWFLQVPACQVTWRDGGGTGALGRAPRVLPVSDTGLCSRTLFHFPSNWYENAANSPEPTAPAGAGSSVVRHGGNKCCKPAP